MTAEMGVEIHQAMGGNVGGMFAGQARRRPDHIAVAMGAEQRTYKELNERVQGGVRELHHVLKQVALVGGVHRHIDGAQVIEPEPGQHRLAVVGG